jgi:uncharacterized protein HemX
MRPVPNASLPCFAADTGDAGHPSAPPAATSPIHRRQLLGGALLAGGALGLGAAAPAVASGSAREQDGKSAATRSQEQAQKHTAAESAVKHPQKHMADEQNAKKAQEVRVKHQERAAEQKKKKTVTQAREENRT